MIVYLCCLTEVKLALMCTSIKQITAYKRQPHFYAPVSRRAVLCNWVWQAGVHTGFRTITLVLYIGSLTNLAT